MNVPADRFRPRPTYTTITGLSTTLRMPRLGKVRLGIKVKKAAADSRCQHAASESCMYCTYPRDVDYFVCPPEVQEVYGEKPTELDVLIPCEDPGMFFPQALKCYKGARLWCKGNGEEATRINMETGALSQVDCPCEHLKSQQNPKGDCDVRANLMVLLPRVSMGGAYQVDTGSTNNVVEINSTLAGLRGMLGRVAFVPLTLKRVPTKMQVVEAGGAVRTATKALLKLEFKGDYQKIAALRQADIIAIEGGSAPIQKALPPRPVEDGEDAAPGAIIVEEAGEFPEEREPGADEQEDAAAVGAAVDPEPAPPAKETPKAAPEPKKDEAALRADLDGLARAAVGVGDFPTAGDAVYAWSKYMKDGKEGGFRSTEKMKDWQMKKAIEKAKAAGYVLPGEGGPF